MKMIMVQRSNFLKDQAEAMANNLSVSPYVNKHITYILMKSDVYGDSVSYLEGTNEMERANNIFTDPPVK